jgi:spoIIIJ-associated protein
MGGLKVQTFQGANIQAAIDQGLAVLKVTRDEVAVEVIEEGKKGFLGFGKKPAVVELKLVAPVISEAPTTTAQTVAPIKPTAHPKPAKRVKQDEAEAVQAVSTYLSQMTTQIGTPVTIKVQRQHKVLTYHLETDKEGLLIGKHGKTINALQYLAQTYYNHHAKGKQTIILEVGDYRKRRAAILVHLADKAAREVVATGQSVKLDPMPAFERKIIHGHLTENSHVQTHSEGHGDRRYLVIDSNRSF